MVKHVVRKDGWINEAQHFCQRTELGGSENVLIDTCRCVTTGRQRGFVYNTPPLQSIKKPEGQFWLLCIVPIFTEYDLQQLHELFNHLRERMARQERHDDARIASRSRRQDRREVTSTNFDHDARLASRNIQPSLNWKNASSFYRSSTQWNHNSWLKNPSSKLDRSMCGNVLDQLS